MGFGRVLRVGICVVVRAQDSAVLAVGQECLNAKFGRQMLILGTNTTLA